MVEGVEVTDTLDNAAMLAVLGENFPNLIELGCSPNYRIVIMHLVLADASQSFHDYGACYVDNGPRVEVFHDSSGRVADRERRGYLSRGGNEEFAEDLSGEYTTLSHTHGFQDFYRAFPFAFV